MQRILQRSVYIVLAAGVLMILATLAYAGGVKACFHWITGWAVVPLAVLYFTSRFSSGRALACALLIASTLIVGVGTFFYVQAFFGRLDPQSAIVFFFVPLYQLSAALVLFCIAYVRSMRRKGSVAHPIGNESH